MKKQIKKPAANLKGERIMARPAVKPKARVYSGKKKSFLSSTTKFSPRNMLIFAGLLAVVGAVILFKVLAATTVILTTEAETMTLPVGVSMVSDTAASSGRAVQYITNGSATTQINLPSPVSSFTVSAKSYRCKHVSNPVMAVAVDGVQSGSSSVSSSSWTGFTYAKALNTGNHTLSVSFTNQGNSKGCNTELFIDKIVFTGEVPVAPTLTLIVSPTSISAGSSSNLTWSSANTTSCTASGTWSGSKSLSGTEPVSPATSSTYTLNCSGIGGNVTKSATVTVTPTSTCPAGTTGTPPNCVTATTSIRPYNATSPFNTLIPSGPVLDANTSIAAWLNQNTPIANAYSWTNRIYIADASTPRYPFDCTEPWGTCELETAGSVPIPNGALAAVELDGHMAVWDKTNGIAYEMWRYAGISGGVARASWGGTISTTGNGVDNPAGDLDANNAPTGAEIGLMSGIVRVDEIKNGLIDHALVIATSNSCSTTTSTFRWPALKSDGNKTTSNCVPEGARIQLDPSINVDAIIGLSSAEKTIAKALQQYGAYNRDNSGVTPWYIVMEIDPAANSGSCPGLGSTYCSTGITGDYVRLLDELAPDGKPLGQHMRVLRQWDGK